MSYEHHIELVYSRLFVTMVLSGILLASIISGANSIPAAPSPGSLAATPLNALSKTGPAKGVGGQS